MAFKISDEQQAIIDSKEDTIVISNPGAGKTTTTAKLAKIFEVTPSDIIQICIELGMLVTKNQRMDWDMIELLADHFQFIPEKITDVGEDLFDFEDSSEEDIANATKGAYQDGNDTVLVLEFVSNQLKAMDKKEFEAKKFVITFKIAADPRSPVCKICRPIVVNTGNIFSKDFL